METLAQIDRDIEKHPKRIAALEAKYGMGFEEFTAYLRNRATMEEEIDSVDPKFILPRVLHQL